MMVTLRHPTLEECQIVREWRNDPAVLPSLRTGYKTEAEQAAFYHDVVCNPASGHRYYALDHVGHFIGLGGLTYLHNIHGEGEISLILGPQFRGGGLGSAAVRALREEGFERLGLKVIIGECFGRNPSAGFWLQELARNPGDLSWRWERPA